MVFPLVRRSRLFRRADVQRRLWRGGLLAPHRFHYFGEFGCLNFFVLGSLQRLFRDAPGVRLDVMTFPITANCWKASSPGTSAAGRSTTRSAKASGRATGRSTPG